MCRAVARSFNGSCLAHLLLLLPFPGLFVLVIKSIITLVAEASRVVTTIVVPTMSSFATTALNMIAGRAHALRIMGSICMWTAVYFSTFSDLVLILRIYILFWILLRILRNLRWLCFTLYLGFVSKRLSIPLEDALGFVFLSYILCLLIFGYLTLLNRFGRFVALIGLFLGVHHRLGGHCPNLRYGGTNSALLL